MNKEYNRLLEVVAALRAPGGCPWDRQQTHKSMTGELTEEAYEFIEAVENDDPRAQMDELGDVLLQVVMHAQIGKEEGAYDMEQVCGHLADKLVHRHPHVFGDVKVSDVDEVWANWEVLKKQEKGYGGRKSALDGIPSTFPALMKGRKLCKRAAKTGFDWPDAKSVFGKLDEETGELREAMEEGDPDHVREELGDVLFVLCALANKLNTDPELALQEANAKFERRFRAMETAITEGGRELKDCSLEEMDAVWDMVKEEEKK
ncbi:MAG: nucleoside triphosphate pyrophosphohydrolase, partial [Abditibacteriota bacterium]|nr:nucleoside triphosphate pyrophosphohydrolase [Abditibacteriota bacterium]